MTSPDTTISITQKFHISGMRIKPLVVEIDHPPKWFQGGTLRGITITRHPPRMIWYWWYLYLLMGRLGSRRRMDLLQRTLDAANREFEKLIEKYRTDPMFYLEQHFLEIPVGRPDGK